MKKQFTLINRVGRVRVFYVQSVAELYQALEGGVLITNQVLMVAVAETVL